MYNHGKITCNLFYVLAQFPLTISERELEFCHQKLNIQVSFRVTQRVEIEDLRKLTNFRGISEIFEKTTFDSCATKLRKVSCEIFLRKPILLNFVDFFAIFCPRLHIIFGSSTRLLQVLMNTRIIQHTIIKRE